MLAAARTNSCPLPPARGIAAVLCAAFLAACQPDTSRIDTAQKAAAATCACPDRTCALRSATPVTEGRGLLMEDYENLSDDQIARYEGAVDRLTDCLNRFDEG